MPQRPLEAGDLSKMQPDREAKYLAQRLATMFQHKWTEAEAYNAKSQAGEMAPSLWNRIKWRKGLLKEQQVRGKLGGGRQRVEKAQPFLESV